MCGLTHLLHLLWSLINTIIITVKCYTSHYSLHTTKCPLSIYNSSHICSNDFLKTFPHDGSVWCLGIGHYLSLVSCLLRSDKLTADCGAASSAPGWLVRTLLTECHRFGLVWVGKWQSNLIVIKHKNMSLCASKSDDQDDSNLFICSDRSPMSQDVVRLWYYSNNET